MIDKELLYNEIMEKVSITVKLVLDETFTTHPYEKIKNYLNKILQENNIAIEIINDDSKNGCKVPYELNKTDNFDDIQLYVWSLVEDITKNEDLYEIVNNAMLLVGYIHSSTTADNKLMYTPKKLNMLDMTHIYFENMQYIYHICPHYVTSKILKIGFVPKAKNSVFSYDPRIHFYYGKYVSDDEYKNLAYQLDLNNHSKGNDHNYDIIKIKIPKNIKFYKDLDSPAGIYTTENISKDYIENVEHIELLDDISFVMRRYGNNTIK